LLSVHRQVSPSFGTSHCNRAPARRWGGGCQGNGCDSHFRHLAPSLGRGIDAESRKGVCCYSETRISTGRKTAEAGRSPASRLRADDIRFVPRPPNSRTDFDFGIPPPGLARKIHRFPAADTNLLVVASRTPSRRRTWAVRVPRSTAGTHPVQSPVRPVSVVDHSSSTPSPASVSSLSKTSTRAVLL